MLETRLNKCYDYDAEGVGRMMDNKTGLKIAYRRKMPETCVRFPLRKKNMRGSIARDGSVPYIGAAVVLVR